MNIAVTIIIPVYNREELVPLTIETIMAQTYSNFECLLIDDGSTDNTINIMDEYVKDDKRFQVYRRPESYIKGPAGCRNFGLDIAKGEYIQFFDSDDLMDERHLKMKIDAFSKETDLVVCQLSEFKDNNISELYGTSCINDKNDLSKHITGEVNYYLPGPMWKKDLIGNDRFCTEIKIYEDLLFNLINRVKCKQVMLINETLIYYRRHDETTTAQVNKDINLLYQKRLAWSYIDTVLMDVVKDKEARKSIRFSLFKYSCLNFYYFLCQKSFVNSLIQFVDMLKYSDSIRDKLILLKLLTLSIVPFLTSKGYSVYKIKNEK